nr:hypothetical protein [Tanacetum cinerariifolium]
MDLKSAQNNVVVKLPLLKQGDYKMWKLKIKQYFEVQDYALWDVIENGNSFNPVCRIITNADGTSTSTISGQVTAEEKAQKKNDVKAKSMLNKPNLETMSFDDLYNNFKNIKQEVKRTVISSSSLGSPDMAFLSSHSSTNKVDTTSIQVSNANTPLSTVSSPNNTANLSDATVYAFLANQPNGSQLVHEDLEQIHKYDLEEMDLKWQLALLSMRARREYKSLKSQESRPRNQDNLRNTMIVEHTSSKVMMAVNGAGFDRSYMSDDKVPTNMALMAFSDSEDKGKGIIKETELPKKLKKKEMIQLSLDEELVQKFYVEELAKEEARQEQDRYNLKMYLKVTNLRRLIGMIVKIWDQVHTFVPKDYEIKREVMKRAGFHLHQASSKKQRLDQQTEETEEEARAQGDSDQEVEELKLYMRIIPEEDIEIESIPLAIKPLVIIEYKIVKEGKISTYHITRADGWTRRYTSMINLLENIDREDLETL